MVDDLFLKETRILCEQQIGAGAPVALQKCLGTGGKGSIGAVSRYNIVRRLGDDKFDADLRMPGVQRAGHRLNN